MIVPTLRTLKGIAAYPELLLLRPNVADDPADALDPSSATIEGEGVLSEQGTFAGAGRTRWSSSFDFLLATHSEQKIYHDHQRYRHGFARSFWMPSWRSDFLPSGHVSPATRDLLAVMPNGAEWAYEDGRYGVAIVSGDVVDVFGVVGYDPNLGLLRLAGAIDYFIDRRLVDMICLVRRVRSAVDEAEWSFLSDAVVKTALPVVEVFGEGVYA